MREENLRNICQKLQPCTIDYKAQLHIHLTNIGPNVWNKSCETLSQRVIWGLESVLGAVIPKPTSPKCYNCVARQGVKKEEN